MGGASLFLLGCQNDGEKATSKVVEIKKAKQLSVDKSFISVQLNNDLALIGGINGLSLSPLTTNIQITQKSTSNFKLPIFTTKSNLENTFSKDSNDTTTISNSEIYSILKIDDGFLIGGNFTTVNGEAKKSFVKITNYGDIDESFSSEIQGGNVYKIIKYKDGYIVAGTFGSYNGVDTTGIVYIDEMGKIINNFSSLDKYMYAEINDMVVLENGNIILAGAFIDQEDSLLTLNSDEYIGDEVISDYAHGVVILKSNGEIDEAMSTKFSAIRDEIYTITLDINKEKIYLGGSFKVEDGNQLYTGIIRYDIQGNIDKKFQVEELFGRIYSIYESDDKVLISGDFVTKKDNDDVRSLMAVNVEDGSTLAMNLTTNCANVYQINKVDNGLIISGDGTFSIGSQDFINNINITLK